jgi:phosphoglycolate phosphatase
LPDRSPVFSVDGLLFDLDGTLWDTTEACAAGWNRVLQRHRIAFRTITAGDVRSVAGNPHEACIRTVFCGLTEAELRPLVDETPDEDNLMVAQMGGRVYPGVAEGLEGLHGTIPMFIVSNCQAGYIETFFERTGFGRFFRDFECWGRTRLSKGENLRDVIRRNGLTAPLFVGDTEGDGAAAAVCGVPFVHVNYGFGRCEIADLRLSMFSELGEVVSAKPPA